MKSRKLKSCPTCGHTICPSCGAVYYVKPKTYCVEHPERSPLTSQLWTWSTTAPCTTTVTTGTYALPNTASTNTVQLKSLDWNNLTTTATNTSASWSVTFPGF